MDTQESGPMTQEDVHSKFMDVLAPSTNEDRDSAPSEERGETVESTEADDADVEYSADADDAESDESEGSEQAQQQPEETPKYQIKVNGEEVEVTLEDLQKGYMMQSDYSRKTQEVSEARKQFQQEQREAQQAQQQKMQELAQRVSQLDQLAESMQSSVDPEQLRDLDPSEYLKHKENLEKLQKSAEEQRKYLQEQHQSYMEQVRQEEQERLLAAIPDWLDSQKAQEGAQRVRQALSEYQFTDEEIGSVMDHRLILAMNDLAKYKAKVHELEQKTSQVKQQVEKAAPLSKPQNNVTNDEKARRMKKLKGDMRSGKSGAAAAAFLDIL